MGWSKALLCTARQMSWPHLTSSTPSHHLTSSHPKGPHATSPRLISPQLNIYLIRPYPAPSNVIFCCPPHLQEPHLLPSHLTSRDFISKYPTSAYAHHLTSSHPLHATRPEILLKQSKLTSVTSFRDMGAKHVLTAEDHFIDHFQPLGHFSGVDGLPGVSHRCQTSRCPNPMQKSMQCHCERVDTRIPFHTWNRWWQMTLKQSYGKQMICTQESNANMSGSHHWFSWGVFCMISPMCPELSRW